MSHDGDIAIAWGAFRTQGMQGMFRMCTVARNGSGDLFVDNDVDLDPRLGPPLEDLIQSPFLVEIRGSSQEEFWT